MQKYIEKWLQIIWKYTGERPPLPNQKLVMDLDVLFLAIQEPFLRIRPHCRKNFLNYNYCFHRCFQMLGMQHFSAYFPSIKSKAKLDSLDQIWKSICTDLGWKYEPLKPVAQFAVKLQ